MMAGKIVYSQKKVRLCGAGVGMLMERYLAKVQAKGRHGSNSHTKTSPLEDLPVNQIRYTGRIKSSSKCSQDNPRIVRERIRY
jgi:hypothetical protein